VIRAAALLLFAFACRAQQDPVPAEGSWIARGFRFGTGETLPELRLHYITLGKPVRDAAGRVSNAVLILHDTASSAQPFLASGFLGVLFLPGQPLDVQKYFVILPDAIGHGDSSKPSDGMRAKFPRYDDEDIVRAQYALVSEGLAVDHLRIVIGAGMGGMHAWLWGERYPGFMDALLPLAATPAQIAGRSRIYRDMIVDSLRSDPARGALTAQYIAFLMNSSALQLEKLAPTRDVADAQFQTFRRRAPRMADPIDLLYQYDASRNYDASPNLEKIQARVLAVNFADDEVNPPELAIMEREIRRVPRARHILVPAGEETRGHASPMRARLWKQYIEELLN
jgi:homoserine O-acetyltransferase